MNATDPLVFTIGFNGYQDIYRRNVATQKRYADRHGMRHVLIDSPEQTDLLMESAWLKIPLIISALKRGWPWLLFIDIDAEIKASCPDFRTLESPGKDIYMAPGFSGRVNSGVIILKNTPLALAMMETILAHADAKIPPEDDVGWGENGHVIHYLKSYSGLQLLPFQWNNNRDPKADDYIRHYSAGPMRKHFPRVEADGAANPNRTRMPAGKRERGAPSFFHDLGSLHAHVVERWAEYF
jgi:hypothetical protein